MTRFLGLISLTTAQKRLENEKPLMLKVLKRSENASLPRILVSDLGKTDIGEFARG